MGRAEQAQWDVPGLASNVLRGGAQGDLVARALSPVGLQEEAMHRLLTAVAARRLSLVILFVAVLLPLVGVGALAEDVWHGELFPFDRPILEFLHTHATPTLDAIMLFFSRAGA